MPILTLELDGFPPADIENRTLVAIASKVANLCEVGPSLIPLYGNVMTSLCSTRLVRLVKLSVVVERLSGR